MAEPRGMDKARSRGGRAGREPIDRDEADRVEIDRNKVDRVEIDRDEAERKEIEREVRSRREFSLADAVGRMASEGFLKGASPVPKLRQVELELEQYVETHLPDGPGALVRALCIEIERNSNVLADHLDDPRRALERILGSLLRTEVGLAQFVTEVDATWGRIYQERPIFERPGQPSDPEDPYTIDVVRAKLEELRATLQG